MKVRAALLLLLAGCGVGAGDESGGDQASTTLVPVEFGRVVRDSISEVLQFTGRLSAPPGGEATLTAPAVGVVRRVAVQLGDRVQLGALVAVIDVPELAADAAQKSAAAAVAEREAARQQQLLADGVTSARQAEEAAAASRQAAAAAQAAVALLARTKVRSPIAGRVQGVEVQPGARVEAGATIARVVSAGRLDLVVSVPIVALRQLRPRMSASVIEDGGAGPVAGFVAGVAPGVDSSTGAGTAVIRIPNDDGTLHPGAAATATVRVGVRHEVLVVPDSSLVLTGDSAALFVVSADSIAHQVVVRVGVRAGHRAEVEGALHPADRVVTAGAFGLEDGMRVVDVRDSADGGS
jgi:membrane fusion protein (multidrug efflux system)